MATEPIPSLDVVRNYMLASGWRLVGEGFLGSTLDFDGAAVALPHSWSGDPVLAHSVIERIADAMSTSPNSLLIALLSRFSDGFQVRLRGDRLGQGSISLGAGHEALKNGRRLLSSAGTSAIRPVRSINRKYSREALDLAKRARLEHTRDGSFIFPIKIDFGLDDDQPVLDTEGMAVEPYARRTTRTLAQALSSVHRLADTSEGDVPENELDDAALTGVSREICQSINDLMRDPDIESVDLSFVWGGSVPPPATVPSSFTFERASRPKLRRMAEQLSMPLEDSEQNFTGTILGIEHNLERTEFYFTLNTYHRARPAQVRVGIDAKTHDRAIHWYRDRATVVVNGRLTEGVSGLRMDVPQSVRAFVMDRLTD